MLGSCCSGRECDTVKIYDGRDAKSNLRHTLCGTINNKVTSSSNVMYLEFRSDGSIPNYGFQATFKSIGQGLLLAYSNIAKIPSVKIYFKHRIRLISVF